MITLIIRCFVIYLIALIVMRVMGKRQIAQMQPFELVITLIIADLATIPMADVSIPLINGVIPLLVLSVLHFILTWLSCMSQKVRNFINGKPVILIGPDGINFNALKRLNITINDIIEQCRFAGYINLEDIQYCIMETNGNISVVPKSSATPIERGDMEIEKSDPTLPYCLINSGKISSENLQILKINEDKLKDFLMQKHIKVKDVLIFNYCNNGCIYMQAKNGKAEVFEKKLTEGESKENE